MTLRASQVARVLGHHLLAAAEELSELEAAEGAEQRAWSDQRSSPLGRRRHCAAVAARLARGEPGAAVVGRRHLLSTWALADELGRVSKGGLLKPGKGAAAADPAPQSVGDDLRRELRLVAGKAAGRR